ncbi:MAG TPA: hypothetical protein VH702_13680 [Vicinamibacterales bacterium]
MAVVVVAPVPLVLVVVEVDVVVFDAVVVVDFATFVEAPFEPAVAAADPFAFVVEDLTGAAG